MDADSEARGGRGGRVGGVPNYRNEILIEIVERHLPQGLEAWREVARQYQIETHELTLRRGEDLRDNWNKKLCNRMQKMTGKLQNVSFDALRLSVAYRMRPTRQFWASTQQSLTTFVTMVRALHREWMW